MATWLRRVVLAGKPMDQDDMIALIRDGVPSSRGTWAEMGAGTGNFTWALRALLGQTATIYAIDRDGKAIRRQNELLAGAKPGASIQPIQADFTHPLTLPSLDGILMANSLHFIRDHLAVLRRMSSYLGLGGRLLIVEYELNTPLPWVPFPVSFEHFAEWTTQAGFRNARQVGRRVSPSSGQAMYAAVAEKA